MQKKSNALIDTLKLVTIFAGFSQENLEILVKDCPTVKHKKGAVLIEESTPASDIYIILKGQISIVLNNCGNPLKVAEFGPGHCIGEASVIGILNHSASALALTDVSLLVLSKKYMMKTFHTDPLLFSLLILNIARELARRLHNTNLLMLDIWKKSGN